MRELPAGTVTFLFSDIEGSTRLMQQLGERWPDVHRDHRRLLRDAFEAGGGRVVDTQGDAFFVAFDRAASALTTAAAAQRALREHVWPDGIELRVRMGIHTGEPELVDDAYVGLDVVRAARLCSAAHGGQVLVSETTRALAGGPAREGVELRDLGERTLKDLERPERVYQLVVPGLPADFPPPRPLAAAAAAPAPSLEARIEDATRGLSESIERMVAESLTDAFADAARPRRASRATLSWLVAILLLVGVPVVYALAR